MRYALLAYVDENEQVAAEERDRGRAASLGLRDELEARGKLCCGELLSTTEASTTVRRRASSLLLADGPFAETRERLAGFFVVECEHLDEAIALAARMPAADRGSVEVRPIRGDEKGEGG